MVVLFVLFTAVAVLVLIVGGIFAYQRRDVWLPYVPFPFPLKEKVVYRSAIGEETEGLVDTNSEGLAEHTEATWATRSSPAKFSFTADGSDSDFD